MQLAINKKIRSEVIFKYCKEAHIKGVVCFSCGNASAALHKIGLDTVDISPSGSLIPNKWWTPEEIKKTWPDRFDATSGHLPLFLMLRIAEEYKMYLNSLEKTMTIKKSVDIPTGSGESFVCISLAFPHIKFNAVYNMGMGTNYEKDSPLNDLIQNMANEIKGL